MIPADRSSSLPARAIWLGRVTIWRVASVVGTSPAEGCAMREMVDVPPAPAVTVFIIGDDTIEEPVVCWISWGWGAAMVTVWPPAAWHQHKHCQDWLPKLSIEASCKFILHHHIFCLIA